MTDGEILYTAQDIADAIGRTDQLVRWTARKKGMGKRIGKRLLVFTVADLEWFRGRPTKGGK